MTKSAVLFLQFIVLHNCMRSIVFEIVPGGGIDGNIDFYLLEAH